MSDKFLRVMSEVAVNSSKLSFIDVMVHSPCRSMICLGTELCASILMLLTRCGVVKRNSRVRRQ